MPKMPYPSFPNKRAIKIAVKRLKNLDIMVLNKLQKTPTAYREIILEELIFEYILFKIFRMRIVTQ